MIKQVIFNSGYMLVPDKEMQKWFFDIFGGDYTCVTGQDCPMYLFNFKDKNKNLPRISHDEIISALSQHTDLNVDIRDIFHDIGRKVFIVMFV